MKCAEAERALAEAFEGEPGGLTNDRLETHLRTCSECRELLAGSLIMRALARITRGRWGIRARSCE